MAKQLRIEFEKWCKQNCSPNAETSEWYWMLFQGGAEAQQRIADEPSARRAAWEHSMRDPLVKRKPLEVYTSNSYRRVGIEGDYQEVVYPYTARDGHPDIGGEPTLRAMVAAFNVMLEHTAEETRECLRDEISTRPTGGAPNVDSGRPAPRTPDNAKAWRDDVCNKCGAELVSDTCDKCGTVNGEVSHE